MLLFVVRRLLQAVPLLLGLTLVAFLLLSITPGGPLAIYKGNPKVRPEDLARLERQLGLDRPWLVRYANWLSGFVRGDWGYSLSNKLPVYPQVRERFTNTLYLMGVSLFVTVLVAVPLSVVSAVRRYSAGDHAISALAFLGQAVPEFWLGLLLILLFAVKLGWLPAGGMFTIGGGFSLLDRARHLVLPVLTIVTVNAGFYTRYLRASLIEVLREDYVRTARAKGLSERVVLYRHALRNALLPFVTVVALHVPAVFAGSVVAEVIFSWPGMGRLFWQAAQLKDYPLLMAMVTVGGLFVILANLAADIVYAMVDPRIQYGHGVDRA